MWLWVLCCCTLVAAQRSWLRLSEEEVPLVLLLKLCLVKVSADAVSLFSRTPVEQALLGQRVPAQGEEWFGVE